jgi:hypothetical protein
VVPEAVGLDAFGWLYAPPAMCGRCDTKQRYIGDHTTTTALRELTVVVVNPTGRASGFDADSGVVCAGPSVVDRLRLVQQGGALQVAHMVELLRRTRSATQPRHTLVEFHPDTPREEEGDDGLSCLAEAVVGMGRGVGQAGLSLDTLHIELHIRTSTRTGSTDTGGALLHRLVQYTTRANETPILDLVRRASVVFVTEAA